MQAPEKNLAFDLLRVTESAALSAARWLGKGAKEDGDGAAVDAMRLSFDSLSIKGRVIIGEGAKDKAPMLYNGEEVGDGTGPDIDIAVDPVEGTNLLALGRPNAIAVIGACKSGYMYNPGSSYYMKKLVVGPEARDVVDIDAPVADNLQAVARAVGKDINDLVVFVLDKPRHKGLIEEIRKMGNVILVIDEVHNIVGAGDAEGSMNAANILKPALSRGEIQVIGATTFTEYRKHIEKDTALERRFQPVTVNEPNMEDTLKILKGIAHYYEQYHGVKIPDGILRQAVLLSERYITDRFLPDKAIDLIDEACSDLNLHDKNINRRMELRREIEDYDKERELLQGAEEPDFERLAELKSLTIKAQTELDELCAQGDPQLTMDNLARVIELWTKIPASRIREDEFRRLSELDKRLKEHIVGQDEAVEAVAAAIRRNRVGISPKHKPVSFIFVGPTGVGKTELVKQLAQDLFNSPDALIRLDMSEFMEKHSVSRIVGSPPGYVGYDEAGQLTEKIRRKPYAVILFDEIEKAHPDVMNVLLQILDDGEITDSHGRKVNFENTVIVMTSNAGSERKEGTVGFGHTVNEQNRDRAMKALGEFLRPEFLNRVDEVICFNRLDEKNFAGIAHIMLDELQKSLEDKGLHFTWDEDVEDYLVKKSYSATYGARNLRRTIQKDLEDPIAEKLIDAYQNPLHALHAKADGEHVTLESE